jgi:hypothetical protein|tara:strand:- start:321 stop:569 length:249 start_codon:yes stop_codon:yes gene_type:complete
MKFTTIYLEENIIEIHNSFLGKETIKVNNEIVSEIRSFFGAEHSFKINENENITDCRIKIGFSLNGVVFNLYKNNKPIIISL